MYFCIIIPFESFSIIIKCIHIHGNVSHYSFLYQRRKIIRVSPVPIKLKSRLIHQIFEMHMNFLHCLNRKLLGQEKKIRDNFSDGESTKSDRNNINNTFSILNVKTITFQLLPSGYRFDLAREYTHISSVNVIIINIMAGVQL